jgi:SAM-dependent methyltransferase
MVHDSKHAGINSVGDQNGGLTDANRRIAKAKKAHLVFERFVEDWSDIKLLDLGCSSAIATEILGPYCRMSVGVDFDLPSLRRAQVRLEKQQSRVSVLNGSAAVLPFGSSTFDAVLCAQVYEHVADQTSLASELFRVLKPGGIVYLTGPNSLWPIEDHYGLIGVHWLPRRLAGHYLALLGRGRSYDEQPRTYWGLRRLLKRFDVFDITPELIRQDWAAGEFIDRGVLSEIASRIPIAILRLAAPLFPNFNWVLLKRIDVISQPKL